MTSRVSYSEEKESQERDEQTEISLQQGLGLSFLLDQCEI